MHAVSKLENVHLYIYNFLVWFQHSIKKKGMNELIMCVCVCIGKIPTGHWGGGDGCKYRLWIIEFKFSSPVKGFLKPIGQVAIQQTLENKS